MLDLKKNDPAVKAEAGFTFNLELPDGTIAEKTTITVRGAQSPAVKNYGRKVYQEFKMKEQAAKRRGKEVEELSLEDAEELAVESAVVRVIGWSGIGEDGKEIPFSKEECTRILTAYPFIRMQVMEQSDNILNFFRQ